MTRYLMSMLAISALGLIGSASIASARGKMPLPPAFTGGNAGAWLGRGPLFGFDSLMTGPGDWGGSGGGPGGSSGGGSGGPSGFLWDPEQGNGGTGGATGEWTKHRGNCWQQLPDDVYGPVFPLCDCVQHPVDFNWTICRFMEEDGTASDCEHDGDVGTCVIQP